METRPYDDFRKKYTGHKSSAKGRGIEFLLTYDQWLNIWLLSGKLDEYGKYVMSRVGDKGAYEIGNVFIQTRIKNSTDPVIGKKAVWSKKEVDYAVSLFLKGHSFCEIGKKLHRSPTASRIKIYRNVSLEAWQKTLREFHASVAVHSAMQ